MVSTIPQNRSYYILRHDACWRRPSVPIDLLSEWFRVETFDYQLLPTLMFVTQVTVLLWILEWNSKTTAFVFAFYLYIIFLDSLLPLVCFLFRLTTGTLKLLTMFWLKFSMNQMDGASKEDCSGVDNKHHSAEMGDLQLGFQTPQKIFSNTTKKLKTFSVVAEPILTSSQRDVCNRTSCEVESQNVKLFYPVHPLFRHSQTKLST